MNTTKILGASLVALSLLGIGCNPFASVQKNVENRVSNAIGEELGERLLEGSAGANVDLEIGKLPANFPSDVLVYPGAEVGSAIVTTQGVGIANFMTTAKAQVVVDWYDRELAADGFVKDEGIAKLGLFRVYEKGEIKMTIQTMEAPDQEKTVITVTRSEVK